MKSDFINFVKFLQNNNVLFGIKSHIKLSPHKNGKPLRSFTPDKKFVKKSAVMLLLKHNANDDYNLIFTLRSSELKSHSGQISFPGGRIEKNETPISAALREVQEEIGIPPEKIELISKLSELYVPPSNSLIAPFVGITNYDDFQLNKSEVQEIFQVPFSYFTNSNNIKTIKREFHGEFIDIPCWDLGKSEVLWGATAMILSEFIDIYNYFKNNAI